MTDQRRTCTGSGVPGSATASLARNFLIIAVALLLLKLLLVSQREIVTEPNDAEGYVSASLDDLGLVVSGAAYHAPGASLVMGLARSLGIPYRIFMEVFLAVAAFLFFRPLVVSMRLGIAAVTFSLRPFALPSRFNPGDGSSNVQFGQLLLLVDRRRRKSLVLFWRPGRTLHGGVLGWPSPASHSRGSRVRGRD